MKARVAIIGASGYIGQHLSNALIQQDIDVIKFSSGKENGLCLETGLFQEGLILPDGIHTVYFLAQSPYYRQMPERSAHLLSVNCIAATQAAEAARRAGVKRFIYTSTGNVYQPSFTALSEEAPIRRDNWYALSKVMAEEALALYRPYLDITVARLFGVYGPQQTDKLVPMLAKMIQNQEDVFVDKNPEDHEDLNGLAVSLLYIDDLVHALIALMDIEHCNVINLAGSSAVSIRELAHELAHCMNLPLSIKIKDVNRAFNLIADNTLQTRLIGQPLVSLPKGIEHSCAARGSK